MKIKNCSLSLNSGIIRPVSHRSSGGEQRFRNLELEVSFHRVSYRLAQFNYAEKHDCCGSLLPTVTKRQRQNRRQS